MDGLEGNRTQDKRREAGQHNGIVRPDEHSRELEPIIWDGKDTKAERKSTNATSSNDSRLVIDGASFFIAFPSCPSTHETFPGQHKCVLSLLKGIGRPDFSSVHHPHQWYFNHMLTASLFPEQSNKGINFWADPIAELMFDNAQREPSWTITSPWNMRTVFLASEHHKPNTHLSHFTRVGKYSSEFENERTRGTKYPPVSIGCTSIISSRRWSSEHLILKLRQIPSVFC